MARIAVGRPVAHARSVDRGQQCSAGRQDYDGVGRQRVQPVARRASTETRSGKRYGGSAGFCRAQRVVRRDDQGVATMTSGHLSSSANPLDVAPCFTAVVGRDVRVAEHGGYCAGRGPDAPARASSRRVGLEALDGRFVSYLLYIAAIYPFPHL